MFVVLMERYSRPEYKTLRAVTFASFGSFGFVPIFHFLIRNGRKLIDEQPIRVAALCLVLMAVIYFIGVYIYCQEIPEKYFPGKYDYWVNLPKISE